MNARQQEKINSYYSAISSFVEDDSAAKSLTSKILKSFAKEDQALLRSILHLSQGDYDELRK